MGGGGGGGGGEVDEGREMINHLSRADAVFHVETEGGVMARLLQLCASIIH